MSSENSSHLEQWMDSLPSQPIATKQTERREEHKRHRPRLQRSVNTIDLDDGDEVVVTTQEPSYSDQSTSFEPSATNLEGSENKPGTVSNPPPGDHTEEDQARLVWMRKKLVELQEQGSFHSFDSTRSTASSFADILQERKGDAVDTLLDLGFAPPGERGSVSRRVPSRFLRSSSTRGISVEEFLNQHPEQNPTDSGESSPYSRGSEWSSSPAGAPQTHLSSSKLVNAARNVILLQRFGTILSNSAKTRQVATVEEEVQEQTLSTLINGHEPSHHPSHEPSHHPSHEPSPSETLCELQPLAHTSDKPELLHSDERLKLDFIERDRMDGNRTSSELLESTPIHTLAKEDLRTSLAAAVIRQTDKTDALAQQEEYQPIRERPLNTNHESVEMSSECGMGNSQERAYIDLKQKDLDQQQQDEEFAVDGVLKVTAEAAMNVFRDPEQSGSVETPSATDTVDNERDYSESAARREVPILEQSHAAPQKKISSRFSRKNVIRYQPDDLYLRYYDLDPNRIHKVNKRIVRKSAIRRSVDSEVGSSIDGELSSRDEADEFEVIDSDMEVVEEELETLSDTEASLTCRSRFSRQKVIRYQPQNLYLNYIDLEPDRIHKKNTKIMRKSAVRRSIDSDEARGQESIPGDMDSIEADHPAQLKNSKFSRQRVIRYEPQTVFLNYVDQDPNRLHKVNTKVKRQAVVKRAGHQDGLREGVQELMSEQGILTGSESEDEWVTLSDSEVMAMSPREKVNTRVSRQKVVRYRPDELYLKYVDVDPEKVEKTNTKVSRKPVLKRPNAGNQGDENEEPVEKVNTVLERKPVVKLPHAGNQDMNESQQSEKINTKLDRQAAIKIPHGRDPDGEYSDSGEENITEKVNTILERQTVVKRLHSEAQPERDQDGKKANTKITRQVVIKKPNEENGYVEVSRMEPIEPAEEDLGQESTAAQSEPKDAKEKVNTQIERKAVVKRPKSENQDQLLAASINSDVSPAKKSKEGRDGEEQVGRDEYVDEKLLQADEETQARRQENVKVNSKLQRKKVVKRSEEGQGGEGGQGQEQAEHEKDEVSGETVDPLSDADMHGFPLIDFNDNKTVSGLASVPSEEFSDDVQRDVEARIPAQVGLSLFNSGSSSGKTPGDGYEDDDEDRKDLLRLMAEQLEADATNGLYHTEEEDEGIDPQNNFFNRLGRMMSTDEPQGTTARDPNKTVHVPDQQDLELLVDIMVQSEATCESDEPDQPWLSTATALDTVKQTETQLAEGSVSQSSQVSAADEAGFENPLFEEVSMEKLEEVSASKLDTTSQDIARSHETHAQDVVPGKIITTDKSKAVKSKTSQDSNSQTEKVQSKKKETKQKQSRKSADSIPSLADAMAHVVAPSIAPALVPANTRSTEAEAPVRDKQGMADTPVRSSEDDARASEDVKAGVDHPASPEHPRSSITSPVPSSTSLYSRESLLQSPVSSDSGCIVGRFSDRSVVTRYIVPPHDPIGSSYDLELNPDTGDLSSLTNKSMNTSSGPSLADSCEVSFTSFGRRNSENFDDDDASHRSRTLSLSSQNEGSVISERSYKSQVRVFVHPEATGSKQRSIATSVVISDDRGWKRHALRSMYRVRDHHILAAMLQTSAFSQVEICEWFPRSQWPLYDDTYPTCKEDLLNEVKLMLAALQKYKSDFEWLDACCTNVYICFALTMSEEDRLCQESVKMIRSEIYDQIYCLEVTLDHRMQLIAADQHIEDFIFNNLSTMHVVAQMIDLMKEQFYHSNVISNLHLYKQVLLESGHSQADVRSLRSLGDERASEGNSTSGLNSDLSDDAMATRLSEFQKQLKAQQNETSAVLSKSLRELRSTLMTEMKRNILGETNEQKGETDEWQENMKSIQDVGAGEQDSA